MCREVECANFITRRFFVPYYLYSGFGFVAFRHLDDAERAISAMNGNDLEGRAIKVEKARRNKGYEKTPGKCKFPCDPSTSWLLSVTHARACCIHLTDTRALWLSRYLFFVNNFFLKFYNG